MIETTNLKLKKYQDSDLADPSIGMNPNMDVIDTEIKKLQDNKANSGHTHTKSNITDFAHNHDDMYYTEYEINTKLIGKAELSHKHVKSEITNFAHTHAMNEITGLELSSTKVNRPNSKTVEESIVANEASISALNTKTDTTNATLNTLKTKVDNGQNFKLTNDNGTYITVSSSNLDNLSHGWINVFNATGTLPTGYNSDNDFIVETKGANANWIRQVIYDVRSFNKFERIKTNGTWQAWRSL